MNILVWFWVKKLAFHVSEQQIFPIIIFKSVLCGEQWIVALNWKLYLLLLQEIDLKIKSKPICFAWMLIRRNPLTRSDKHIRTCWYFYFFKTHSKKTENLIFFVSQKPIDPGTLNKMYTRTGYLFLMEKKALGTTWSKCYCHYQREGRLFRMIPYIQVKKSVVLLD